MDSPASIVGHSEGDLVLRALGVNRLAIPIPFPEAGGPVNVYLLDEPDGSVTMFDTGLGTDEAKAALLRGFEEAHRRIEDVSRIVLSHGHVDHYGLARFVSERSGAKVFIHPSDATKVLAGHERVKYPAAFREYLLNLGTPEQQLPELEELYRGLGGFAARLNAVEQIDEGDRLKLAHFEAEVMHMPGHTPGLVCLNVPEHRIVFTDDHLLARVSPNPLIELGPNGEKFRALPAYFRSAKRLRDLEIDWVLPGHGSPFKGHRARIDSLFGFYAKRQDKIVHALDKPKTIHDLVVDVFGAAQVLQLFLMLSEIVGNVEVLEDQGRVRRVEGARPFRFVRAD